jgi:hypothetical protein
MFSILRKATIHPVENITGFRRGYFFLRSVGIDFLGNVSTGSYIAYDEYPAYVALLSNQVSFRL